MPDLCELERRFRATNPDLRDASDRLCDARDYLEKNPVSARAVQEYECARHIVYTLFDKYADAKAELDRIDRDVAHARHVADRLRAQLDRQTFLTSPTGLVVIGFAEVVLVFLFSLGCLVNLPVGVWAVLFLLASFGVVSLTVLGASQHRQANQPRRDYLADQLAAAEQTVADRERDRCGLYAISTASTASYHPTIRSMTWSSSSSVNSTQSALPWWTSFGAPPVSTGSASHEK